MRSHELVTPALLIDGEALERNLATMATRLPGPKLRPHMKAHKSTALARRQVAHGHDGFTCATIRECEGMVAAGLGSSLLLANEVMDARRLGALAATEGVSVIVAVDSDATLEAAVAGGVREVVIDVHIGLPRCGCDVGDAGRLAERARAAGLTVRGVMGYEGHLMMQLDVEVQRARVEASMAVLRTAHAEVGGDLVSAGGTGTHAVNVWATEIQAGSYAVMDSDYAKRGEGFEQALLVEATVIAVNPKGWAVADAGLKCFGMDHGLPALPGAEVLFCSDEHVTFRPDPAWRLRPGDRVRLVPAHCDPTIAYHEHLWCVRGLSPRDTAAHGPVAPIEVVERWAVDLRGW
jgi:D-serine deaminase-like pyridoxal phosphate-dependent protein